ncbi:MAG: hypothetical protein AB8H79_25550 [Myxococcota bacterium]
MTRTLSLLALLTLGACLEPAELTDDTDVDTDIDTDVDTDTDTDTDPPLDLNHGGTLYEAPMLVNWAWTEASDAGICVTVIVENIGPDALGYKMTLTTDVALGDFTIFGAAGRARSQPTRLEIDNPHAALESGETDEIIVCNDEPFEFVSLLDQEFFYPEDPPDRIAGSIMDANAQFLLGYEQNGRANNGDCLDLTVTNISIHSFTRFNLEVTFPEPAEIKLYSGMPANSTANSSKVRLWPASGDDVLPLHPFQEMTGQLCIDKAQHPGSMRANDVEIVVWD